MVIPALVHLPQEDDVIRNLALCQLLDLPPCMLVTGLQSTMATSIKLTDSTALTDQAIRGWCMTMNICADGSAQALVGAGQEEWRIALCKYQSQLRDAANG